MKLAGWSIQHGILDLRFRMFMAIWFLKNPKTVSGKIYGEIIV